MSDRLTAPILVATRKYEHELFSVASPMTFNWPPPLTHAVSRSSGARYYRCALQVNTPMQGRFKGFDSKHPKHSPLYKRDYGLALAQKCKKHNIDVVGICDHNNVDYIEVVRKELTQEGIHVFPGFEIASTEGLHLLCLFDPLMPTEEIDHVITALKLPPKERWVTSVGGVPKQSPLSFPEIIEHIQRERRGICIAAHMDRENGLLFECAKTTRVQYFTDNNLLAGQISGSVAELMLFHRKVVTGELNHYRRERPLALLNCLDVYNLKDLDQPACCSSIKMSSPSIEGLWQAFLDPDSRLRLLTEERAARSRTKREQEKVELIALTWEGGFLSECGIHFNKNLNCLIGGRGTGKSSIIESLRYVLDQKPLGALAQEAHKSIVKDVVKPATKISLLVRTHHPAPAYYRIERSVSDPPLAPVVFNEQGERSELKVFDLMPQIDLFGQHEISEIARQPEKQLELLKRFRPMGSSKYDAERNEQLELLALNRDHILRARRELQALEEKLGRLPSLEEKLRRFEHHGLEAKLHEQAQLTREEAILKAGRERVASFRKPLDLMRQKLELENANLDGKLEGAPNADLMKKIAHTQQQFIDTLRQGIADLEELVDQSQRRMLEHSKEWEARRSKRQDEYQKTLRQLQHEAIDGQAYLRLRREMEELAPLRLQFAQQSQKLLDLENKRRRALSRLHEACKQIYKLDLQAARKVSKLLEGKVRVSVTLEDERESLYKKLRGLKLGVRGDFLSKLQSLENFSLVDFIAHLRAGAAALTEHYELAPKVAEKVARLDERTVLQLEEMPPATNVCIEHNIVASEQEPVWRKLDEVSTGQRATAILLMLFPESHTPLVIDQPEDDLDNRFIAEQVIPKLREEKQRRQFLFATHNANLPVLGDAELIVALEARGDSQQGHAQILESNLGAIDRESVKLCVEQVLEGGKQAFERRRAKYGF